MAKKEVDIEEIHDIAEDLCSIYCRVPDIEEERFVEAICEACPLNLFLIKLAGGYTQDDNHRN